jgi:hypothetical protein
MRRVQMRSFLAVLGALAFAGCPRPVPKPSGPTPPPVPTPTPAPTPPPPPYVPNKKLETGRIFNGMQYKVTLETDFGTTATKDREIPENYLAELTVKVKVPKPHTDLEELKRLNARLPELLPALPQLLERAKVSPFFDDLYRLKCTNLRASMNRLDNLLTRHNFYDCETILELQHPETKRRALLIQADMDVDEDGSDPDRIPEVDSSSLTFQPFTSYRWLKKSDRVNPFLASRQARLDKAKADLSIPGLAPAKAKDLRATVEQMEQEIYSLTHYNFLVGSVDPFIVLPGSIVGKASPFSPTPGDYCVVVFDKMLYPAVVGDVGPVYKIGEAALRIARQINAQADPNNRATSDLKATYLVFPGTAEKPFATPNLEKWRTRCEKLVTELGGHAGEMFAWEDLTKPPPPPPPPADPAPAPSPEPKPATAPNR